MITDKEKKNVEQDEIEIRRELEAIQLLCDTLRAFAPDAREKIVSYVKNRLGIAGLR